MLTRAMAWPALWWFTRSSIGSSLWRIGGGSILLVDYLVFNSINFRNRLYSFLSDIRSGK